MFLEYQNEIIALITITVLLIIYTLMKKKTPKQDKKKENILQEIEEQEVTSIVDPYDEEIIEEASSEIDDIEKLSGSEEGDFGIQKTQENTKDQTETKKTIKKREIPQHGKITKQHFVEFTGKRILVAEDNLINQKVLTGLLAGSGIEIKIANDGQEALDILAKDDDFLMVLMDAHMPHVDGFEATKQIRKNPKYDHIVVVALSGDTAADDVRKMRESGMAEHLEKPLRMESLYEILYAYSGEQSNNESDYIEVVMTKELNGDKGLAICGGDEHFYLEILHEFVQTYADSAVTIHELLKENRLNAADKLLLDIIGVSANIGADPLTKIANDLKDALRDTEEKSYLILLEQYQVHLEELLKDIKEFTES